MEMYEMALVQIEQKRAALDKQELAILVEYKDTLTQGWRNGDVITAHSLQSGHSVTAPYVPDPLFDSPGGVALSLRWGMESDESDDVFYPITYYRFENVSLRARKEAGKL
jgi:hypothetical protein